MISDVRLSVGRTIKREHLKRISESKLTLEIRLDPEYNCSRNEYTQRSGDLLFGRTRGAILALLYGRADQSSYTRQIAREVDASVGAVQRELENPRKWVLSFAVHWQPSFLSGEPTRPHISRDAGPGEQELASLASCARHCILWRSESLWHLCNGSVAREEETAQSDVDLMVVGKATLDEILSHGSLQWRKHQCPINPTVWYSVEEFKSKLASGNHF